MDKYLDLARELKKTMEYESDNYTYCNWCSWYSHQRIGTRTGGLGNSRISGDHSNYCIIEISQNTEKSPGETWGLSDSSERPSANTDAKNSQGVMMIIIIIIIIIIMKCASTQSFEIKAK